MSTFCKQSETCIQIVVAYFCKSICQENSTPGKREQIIVLRHDDLTKPFADLEIFERGCSLSWLFLSTIRSGKGGCSPKNCQKGPFWGKIFRPKGGGGWNPRNPPPKSANAKLRYTLLYCIWCHRKREPQGEIMGFCSSSIQVFHFE